MGYKINYITISALFLFCGLQQPCAAKENPVNPSQLPQTKQHTQKINFDELSIDQEIAQVLMIAVDLSKDINKYKSLLERGLVGGVFLQWGDYSLAETRGITKKLQSWSKVPLLIAADYEGGVTITPTTLGLANLPTNMMLGAANSEKETATLFYLAGLELKRAGINVNFSPVLDVNTNMYNPIIGVRSFGSNPEMASILGTAVINGLQASGVAAVAKHFPGHGDVSVDTHRALAVTNMSLEKMEDIHIMPFKSAIKAGVMGIMTAHVTYNAIDRDNIATFSEKILKNKLKNDLGFKGVVISDSLDMKASRQNGSITHAAIKALNAGVDLLVLRNVSPERVHSKIKQELGLSVKPSRLAFSAKKVFELKEKLGLFNGGGDAVPATDKAYQKTASALAKKAITLVRDRGNIIPFTAKQGKTPPKVCTVFFSPPRFAQDLLNISKPFIDAGWLVTQYNARLSARNKDLEYASECIRNADISVIGSFQWANKPYYSQVKIIGELLKIDKPIVLLSLMSPFDIRFHLRAKTVLALYGISPYSMQGAAQIILGQIKPKGKIPVELLPFEKLSKINGKKKK